MTAKKTTKKPRNRAAQDATMINIRALKRRLTKLETRVSAMEHAMIASDIKAARFVR